MKTREELFQLICDEGVDAFNAYRRETEYEVVNLSHLDFTGMDLSGINLSQSVLHGTCFDMCLMHDVTLIFAQLIRASLRETQLDLVNATEADFTEADLYQATLNGAMLLEATLEGVDARQARFSDADLSGANLKRAQLNDADFTGATLSGADLTDAEMEWAILTGVRFSPMTRWGNQTPPGAVPFSN